MKNPVYDLPLQGAYIYLFRWSRWLFLASCSASFFRQHKTLEADAFRWLMVGCALFSSAKEISDISASMRTLSHW